MAICTSITLVEHDAHLGDLLDVCIDNDVHALWFYTQTDAMQFVGKEVIVDYRNDIYKGDVRVFIKTFTIPTIVRTVEAEKDFKLFTDAKDNNCNIVFSEFSENDSKIGCIVFCTCQEYKSSEKAVWMELIIRDKLMRTAKLRIFDYENLEASLAGKYIAACLVKTKYGFQTREAKPLSGSAEENPEVAIAEAYIRNYFANDPIAMDYVNKLNLLEVMKQHVDYELGYGLMRMATELSMAAALRNVTNDISVETLSYIILASYSYLCRDSALSASFNNTLLASQHGWRNRHAVVVALDDGAVSKPREYDVWKDIQRSTNTILEIRKGTTYGGK